MAAGLRYILGMVAGFALAGVLWAGFVWPFIGFPLTADALYIREWYRQQDEIAGRRASGPRLILAGGSGVLYGISAQSLAGEFDVEAVNYGTHAGLPLDYILHKVKQISRPGDLIVLALEYEYYRKGNRLNSMSTHYFLGGDPSYLRHLGLQRSLECFFTPDAVLWQQRRELSRPHRREQTARDARSARASMNSYGDRQNHTRSSMTPEQIEVQARIEPTRALNDEDLMSNTSVWRQIEDFAAWCTRHDVWLVATMPNTLDDPLLHETIARENLEEIVRRYEARGIPFVGEPEAGFLPRRKFYDTEYHPTEEAKLLRTRDLAEALRPIIVEWKDAY